MTVHSRGDVVLVGFVFAEESGKKFRPAVVISSPAYHRGRQEVVVVAITSNVKRRLFGDHLITDWKGAGLLFPSVATGILRTIKRGMIGRKLGSLAKADGEAIDGQLRRCLGL
jgi:mRNA-degrading endonuclease toxin of MazEF toxin-antitoxin module